MHAHIVIAVGPVIDVPPVPVNATSTESIILSCDASGFPVPSVTWLHNGTEVSCFRHTGTHEHQLRSQPFITINFQLQDDGSRTNITEIVGNRSISSTLMIGMAMRNDTGNYICNVSSPLYTSVASEPALVLVQGLLLNHFTKCVTPTVLSLCTIHYYNTMCNNDT